MPFDEKKNDRKCIPHHPPLFYFLFFLQATLDDMEDELLVGSNHILPDHFSQSREFDLLQVGHVLFFQKLE